MNKRKKWSIVALVICIIGGIVMFSLNHQKEKTVEEKMRIEQDRIALFVVNRVKLKTQNPIETIEFIEFRKNETNTLVNVHQNMPHAKRAPEGALMIPSFLAFNTCVGVWIDSGILFHLSNDSAAVCPLL